jgi:TATA-binding protein-associated factor Taf7
VLILKKQESLYEYYRYVMLDLVWLCMKNEYMSFGMRIWLTLDLLWMERVKNFLSGENQAAVKVEAAEAAVKAEAAEDEEDYDEEEDEEDDDQENLVNQ